MRGFYEHIVPSVETGESEHVVAVVEAMCSLHRDLGAHDVAIANAFEAALVIHYLPLDILRQSCETDMWFLL